MLCLQGCTAVKPKMTNGIPYDFILLETDLCDIPKA